MGGGEGIKQLLIGRLNSDASTGVASAEIRCQIDEISNSDDAVGIDVPLLPGDSGMAEVGGEVDEIGDGDLAVEVDVADAGGTDENEAADGGDAQSGAGVRGEGRIVDAL